MSTRPSTAPVALLLTSGTVLLLALVAVIPTSSASVVYSDVAGQPQTSSTVTSTDPAALAVAIVLLVLAVVSFVGAGLLWHHRRTAIRNER